VQGRDPVTTLRIDNRPEPTRVWLVGLWRYRSVLWALARKDFKVRYKRASLGVFWAVAMPLLQASVMAFIFSRVGQFGAGQNFSYAGFVLAGMVPWFYASSSVPAETSAIVDGSSLADKVWFPRAILVLVPATANLVTLGISTVILLVALPIVGEPYTVQLLLLVPAAALLVAFVASLGLVLSAAHAYFRDVKFMVAAGMLIWFYVTPVVYPPSALGSAARWLDFNPLTGIVGLFQRAAVDAPVPSGRSLAVSIGTTLVLMVAAVVIHRRHDRLFVDLL
jgi:ABC-type polysaccharide/polyol phosphate export permease